MKELSLPNQKKKQYNPDEIVRGEAVLLNIVDGFRRGFQLASGTHTDESSVCGFL
jgi:hypothetical protein